MRGRGSMRGRVAKGRVAKEGRVAGRQRCSLIFVGCRISDVTLQYLTNKEHQGPNEVRQGQWVDKVCLPANLPANDDRPIPSSRPERPYIIIRARI
jgi:hypothetical protein